MSDLEKQHSLTYLNAAQYAAPPPTKFANPGPLGLFSFASTTLILSLFNLNARDITVPNIVVGQAVAVGGLCQVLAGIGEFFTGNMFGCTAFTSYGGFWLAYSLILMPGSGILDAYAKNPDQIASALGIWLITWFVLTFILFIASLRSNVATTLVFLFLFVTFIILAAANFTGNATIAKAGGAMGVVTALQAYYTGAAQLYTPSATYFTLPVGDLPKHE